MVPATWPMRQWISDHEVKHYKKQTFNLSGRWHQNTFAGLVKANRKVQVLTTSFHNAVYYSSNQNNHQDII